MNWLKFVEAVIVVGAVAFGFGVICAVVSYGAKAIQRSWLDEAEDEAFIPPSHAKQADVVQISHRRIH